MRKLAIAYAFFLAACGAASEIQEAPPLKPGPKEEAQDRIEDSSVSSGGFEMFVTDAFAITGRSGFVSGQIASGSVAVGDTICMISREQGSRKFVVGSIERFNKVLETASAGIHVGLELKGFDAKSWNRGDQITLRAAC